MSCLLLRLNAFGSDFRNSSRRIWVLWSSTSGLLLRNLEQVIIICILNNRVSLQWLVHSPKKEYSDNDCGSGSEVIKRVPTRVQKNVSNLLSSRCSLIYKCIFAQELILKSPMQSPDRIRALLHLQ